MSANDDADAQQHAVSIRRSPTADTTRSLEPTRCSKISCASAERQDDFYENLYFAIVTVAAFGGGITFAGIITNIEDGNGSHRAESRFTQHRARSFLAISWFLFTLDLCLSSTLIAASYLYRRTLNEAHWANSPIQWANLLSALLLPGLLVAALLMASLAVCAYCEETGWIAVGFCIFFGVLIVGWWFVYLGHNVAKIQKRKKVHPRHKRQRDAEAYVMQPVVKGPAASLRSLH